MKERIQNLAIKLAGDYWFRMQKSRRISIALSLSFFMLLIVPVLRKAVGE